MTSIQPREKTHLPPTGSGAELTSAESLKKLTALLDLMGIDSGFLQLGGSIDPLSPEQRADHLVAAHIKTLIRRLPLPANPKKNRPAETCPYSGLNRNQIDEASIPHKDGRPRIRTISLAEKEAGETKGARFYHVQDALDFMNYLSERQNHDSTE